MWLTPWAEYQAQLRCKYQVVCGLGPRVPDRTLAVTEERAQQNLLVGTAEGKWCHGEGWSLGAKWWCWFPSVLGAIRRNLCDKLSSAFHLSEESVYSPIRSPNYSLSDANPRIALLLMAVFCKCQTKIYMYWSEDGGRRKNNWDCCCQLRWRRLLSVSRH